MIYLPSADAAKMTTAAATEMMNAGELGSVAEVPSTVTVTSPGRTPHILPIRKGRKRTPEAPK